MMINWKKAVVVTAAAAMLIPMAACGGNDNNSNGAIKKGQYLHVKGVKLKFPQGIVLDLSEKKKEDK